MGSTVLEGVMPRKKTVRRRTQKPMLNVLKTAETVVVANAATTAFFGCRLDEFLLDGWARPMTGNVRAQGTSGYGQYLGGTNNSWELSMAEIVKGLIPGGEGFGQGGTWTVGKAIKHNLKSNPMAVATMFLAPVAFRAGKKVLARPLINPLNRMVRQIGAGSVVKF